MTVRDKLNQINAPIVFSNDEGEDCENCLYYQIMTPSFNIYLDVTSSNSTLKIYQNQRQIEYKIASVDECINVIKQYV